MAKCNREGGPFGISKPHPKSDSPKPRCEVCQLPRVHRAGRCFAHRWNPPEAIYATREETWAAIGHLTRDENDNRDWGALMKAVHAKWGHLPADVLGEYVNEAITRTMDGLRRWPRRIKITTFLVQVVRSLISAAAERVAADWNEAGALRYSEYGRPRAAWSTRKVVRLRFDPTRERTPARAANTAAPDHDSDKDKPLAGLRSLQGGSTPTGSKVIHGYIFESGTDMDSYLGKK